MKQSAHIFDPKDDSLEARIEAYRSVQEAWISIEESLKHWNDPEWQNALGEYSELEEAHKIVLNSLNEATQSIAVEDVDKAKEQGLMTSDEAYEFVKEKVDQQSSLSVKSKHSSGFKL